VHRDDRHKYECVYGALARHRRYQIRINPISLDEKDTAAHMLYQFCKDQCLGFFAYVAQTAAVMKSLMCYQYNARVRAAATTIIPLLLKSVILNANKINNQNKDKYFKIFDQLFEPFMTALIGEPDVCESIPILEVLAQIAVIMGNDKNEIWRFEERHLDKISSVCESLLTESQMRIKERVLNDKNEKLICDFESLNRREWANEVESELFAHIIDVAEYTFKASKEKFAPFFIENKLGNVCKQILWTSVLDILGACLDKEQILVSWVDCLNFCVVFGVMGVNYQFYTPF